MNTLSGTPTVADRGTLLLLQIGTDWYEVTPLRPGLDVRRAWRLRKLGTESAYDVCERGSGLSCECLGWLRWQKCKHCSAVAAYFSPVFAAGHLGDR